jgi:hypothetical protein
LHNKSIFDVRTLNALRRIKVLCATIFCKKLVQVKRVYYFCVRSGRVVVHCVVMLRNRNSMKQKETALYTPPRWWNW